MGELSASLESISSRYAELYSIERSSEWFMLKLQEEVGELVQAFIDLHGMGRDRGATEAEKKQAFQDELADVLGQLLLLARHHEVDLDAAVEKKWLKWS
ncbi:MazG nucleotide pyrophosphohydrolase domain-containing protein [Nesterenkonia ebinurensis]|uniref:MazG nucleotide pyrophosphohydrolase domain-containing protein n=1 Tax=Nesterenkonia ebinurensis TaxID=2608252 RepID=UPI001CC76031|nr:MazG nucleotide pyrophosphohydrolase domain-containing protein [Nesterenkonia ebinurensis]